MTPTNDTHNLQKRVLLVRPSTHIDIADFTGFSAAEPLDLSYLAAYAKADGFDCDCVDMLFDKKRRNIVKLLKVKKYDLVAFTGHVTAHKAVNDLAKKVKEFDQNMPIVVSGIMAAVNPHVYDTGNIDAIIRSDPYETFSQILQKLQVGDRDFVSITGVYHKDKPIGEVVRYIPKHRPLREKLAQYAKHYRHSYYGECVTIKTSYGCPNTCNYCLHAKGGHDKYWERDLEDVFDEIEETKENFIMLIDDNFTANMRRVDAFCEGLEKRNIKKDFFMQGTCKSIATNPDIIRRFSKNGLKYVFLGVESFDDRVLTELNKRSTAQHNHDTLALLTELKVEVNPGIICMPYFGVADFDSLIENLTKYLPIFPMVNTLTPMPGTPMHETHKDETLVNQQNYEVFNMMELIIVPQQMPKKEFYQNILRVYRATMGSPITLDYIKTRYGSKELLRHRLISGKVQRKINRLIKG